MLAVGTSHLARLSVVPPIDTIAVSLPHVPVPVELLARRRDEHTEAMLETALPFAFVTAVVDEVVLRGVDGGGGERLRGGGGERLRGKGARRNPNQLTSPHPCMRPFSHSPS